jgi:hypothetical protein
LPIPARPGRKNATANFLYRRTQKLFFAEMREAGARVFKILFFSKKQI